MSFASVWSEITPKRPLNELDSNFVYVGQSGQAGNRMAVAVSCQSFTDRPEVSFALNFGRSNR